MKDIAMAGFCDVVAKQTGGTDRKLPFQKGRSILAALKDTSNPSKNSCTDAQGPFDQSVEGGIVPALEGVKPSDTLQETVLDDAV